MGKTASDSGESLCGEEDQAVRKDLKELGTDSDASDPEVMRCAKQSVAGAFCGGRQLRLGQETFQEEKMRMEKVAKMRKVASSSAQPAPQAASSYYQKKDKKEPPKANAKSGPAPAAPTTAPSVAAPAAASRPRTAAGAGAPNRPRGRAATQAPV